MVGNKENFQITQKAIRKVYPEITPNGMNAILANIEIETSFQNFVEIPQSYNQVINNPDLISMNENLEKAGIENEQQYNQLTDLQKLAVLYHGDKTKTTAGGVGALQLTSKTFGLEEDDFPERLENVAEQLKLKPNELYNKARESAEFAALLSLYDLKINKNVSADDINKLTGKQLREKYINPGETQGTATNAQKIRNEIFQKYNNKNTDVTTVKTIDEAKKDENFEIGNDRQNVYLDFVKKAKNVFQQYSGTALDEKVKELTQHPGYKFTLPGIVAHANTKLVSSEDYNPEVDLLPPASSSLPKLYENRFIKDSKPQNLFDRLFTRDEQGDIIELDNEELYQQAVAGDAIASGYDPRKLYPDSIYDKPDLSDVIVRADVPEIKLDPKERVAGEQSLELKGSPRTQEEILKEIEGSSERYLEAEKDVKKKERQKKIREVKAKIPKLSKAKMPKLSEGLLTGLKAAAGDISLSKALKNDIVKTELSPLLQEALTKQKELSKSGLTAEEKAAAMKNINDGYAGAMKNVLRASGGQRGAYLANQGVVDANRVSSLIDLAGKDAAIRRQNIGQYNQLATAVGKMQLQADLSNEQLRQQTVVQNRNILGNLSTNLLSSALDDASAYLNPNTKAISSLVNSTIKKIQEGNLGNTTEGIDTDLKI